MTSPDARPDLSRRLAAELGAPSLHQGEHLQHPVVHGTGQPRTLRRRGRLPLGAIALHGGPLQRLHEVADHGSADDEQEDVAVGALGDLLTDQQVGAPDQQSRDQPAAPAGPRGPGQHR